MITCHEITEYMEQIAPSELAEEWDNTGLLVGDAQSRIGKVMLCMDITAASVDEAIARKADLIITHHPVIFKGLKRLVAADPKGAALYGLIRNNIAVYSAHTNLDYAAGGVNTQLALLLGLKQTEILGAGPGKTGLLSKTMPLAQYIKLVKKALDVPFVRVVGNTERTVEKVAVFSGSFDDDIEAVLKSGADVLVTGDLKYHTALDAAEVGLCMIDAGHFNTERIVLPALEAKLVRKFPQLEVFCFIKEEDPFKTC
jgi:dinuclear metal center YbgI/SA1388 family protein